LCIYVKTEIIHFKKSKKYLRKTNKSMLNSICRCFWGEKEEEIDYSVLSKIEQPDVNLDITRAGKLDVYNKIKCL